MEPVNILHYFRQYTADVGVHLPTINNPPIVLPGILDASVPYYREYLGQT